jgi:hypothetical protein
MKDNAEYCTGQDFRPVFTTQPPTPDPFRLWQCKQCVYEIAQRPPSDNPPMLPAHHPMPIPARFTMTEEQKHRLRARLLIDQLEDLDIDNL